MSETALIPTQAPAVPTLPEIDALIQANDLEPGRVQGIVGSYAPFVAAMLEALPAARAIQVTDESQVGAMKAAREQRLVLKRIRVDMDKARKDLKAESLRTGRLIDGIANTIENKLSTEEVRLMDAETFAERAAKAREQALAKKRLDLLAGLPVTAADVAMLGTMSDAAFDAMHHGLVVQRDAQLKAEADRKAAEEQARRQAEEDRKAREAEAARLAQENARLRAEKAEAEKAAQQARAAEWRAKREAEKAAQQARAAEWRAKREAEEAKAQAAAAADPAVKAELATAGTMPAPVNLGATVAERKARDIEAMRIYADKVSPKVSGLKAQYVNYAPSIATLERLVVVAEDACREMHRVIDQYEQH